MSGTNVSEFGYLFEDVFQGQSRITRAVTALVGADLSFKKIGLLVALGAVNLAVLQDRRFRWLLLVICVPFTTLWALNFSYDPRNLALALPIWSLTTAVGMQIVFRQVDRLIKTYSSWFELMKRDNIVSRHGIAGVLVAAALAATLVLNRLLPETRLMTRQSFIEVDKSVDDPKTVATMVAMIGYLGGPYRIFSEWRWACAFHFNSNNRCQRIVPDEFFQRKGKHHVNDSADGILIILYQSSMTANRSEMLRADGFTQAAEVSENGRTVSFFVRKVSGNLP
jgi:hypothetical protein